MFKPMLAATIDDIEKLAYPVLASPKLDGIRAVVIGGVLLSRNLKPIPNAYVQAMFGRQDFNGLDGELIVGDPCSPTAFRDTSSAVMSRDGHPHVRFYVFDDFSQAAVIFSHRQKKLLARTLPGCLKWACSTANNAAELTELEELWLADGYEGAMVRSAASPYKFGRSTLKEGYLLKLKRFCDGEAVVIGMEERMHNANEVVPSAIGGTKRSSHKANMRGRGDLGALVVRDLVTGVEFNIGTGFDDKDRELFWGESCSYIGRVVKYKYFPSGSKDKPRFPVFVGFRDAADL